MIITIKSSGIALDLPKEHKLNIELTSPIFCKQSSASLPISIPLSDHNKRALNYPNILNICDINTRSISPSVDIEVIITQGSWQQEATMCISGGSDTAVEATLYINESSIWSRIEDLTLPQVMAGLHFGEIPPASAYDSEETIRTYRQTIAEAMYDYMLPPYYGDPRSLEWYKSHDFFVAPVKTNDGWLNELSCIRRWYSNGEQEGFNLKIIHDSHDIYDKTIRLRNLQDWYTTSALHNATSPTYDSEEGLKIIGYKNEQQYYCISPFLRLDIVLRQIFNYAGYELIYDIFSGNTIDDYYIDEELWHSIVVLNNTIDALLPGCIYYSSLVPDIPCKDFLLAVCAQFGTRFILQDDKKTVVLAFSDVIITNPINRKINSHLHWGIEYNIKVDHDPLDDISKTTESENIYNPSEMDSLKDARTSLLHIRYDQIDTTALNCGFCQRTTSSIISGLNEIKQSECPLVFGILQSSKLITDTSYPFYPNIVCHPTISQYMGITTSPEEKFNSKDGLCRYFNELYISISQNVDRITTEETIQNKDLIEFDFTRQAIIQGRCCFPEKLQFELQNSPIQHVKVTYIALRE